MPRATRSGATPKAKTPNKKAPSKSEPKKSPRSAKAQSPVSASRQSLRRRTKESHEVDSLTSPELKETSSKRRRISAPLPATTTPPASRKRKATPKQSPNRSTPITAKSPVCKKAKIISPIDPQDQKQESPILPPSTIVTPIKPEQQQCEQPEQRLTAKRTLTEDEVCSVEVDSDQEVITVTRRGTKRSKPGIKKAQGDVHPPKQKKQKQPPKKSEIVVVAAEPSNPGDQQEEKEQEGVVVGPTTAIEKVSEPKTKTPTKQELLTLQRRQLLQRLDHYDLSDLTSLSNLLTDWPESDACVVPSEGFQLPIPATQRIWVARDHSPSHELVNGSAQNENLEAPTTKKNRMLPLSSLMPTEEPEEAVNRDKSEQQRELDNFSVASFTLPTVRSDKDKAVEKNLQIDEHEQLIREVCTINPDVFCVKQARPDYASTLLIQDLSRKGYQCSACTDNGSSSANRSSGPTSYQSFIFYSRNVFSEVSFHHLPVQSVARKLVKKSAYPQVWRDCICQSLSACLGDTSGPPELYVSVLCHYATKALLLVGCLTERSHLDEFPTLAPTMPPISQLPPTTAPSIPYVPGPGGSSTVTVSLAGCRSSVHSSFSFAGSEWCPPSFDSRPDLATINAAGTLWALQDIWEGLQEPSTHINGSQVVCTPERPLVNGFGGSDHLPSSPPASQPMRWVLCTNLEAAPTSPVYQIFRDGYPSDESLARLRAVRNIHHNDADFLDSTSLIDLLWHAFQHPCTDVRSCYQSVMGNEPPFSRYAQQPPEAPGGSPRLIPRKCVDYIFCSGSSLHPKEVLVPPIRAIIAATSANVSQYHRLSATPVALTTETPISLATKIGILA